MSFIWTGSGHDHPAPSGRGSPDDPAEPDEASGLPSFRCRFSISSSSGYSGTSSFSKRTSASSMRGVGGNPKAIQPVRPFIDEDSRCSCFSWSGFSASWAGVALAGITTSADANMARNYTLHRRGQRHPRRRHLCRGQGIRGRGRARRLHHDLGREPCSLSSAFPRTGRSAPRDAIILGVLLLNTIVKRTGKVHYV